VKIVAVLILVAWASVAQSADISVRMQGTPAEGVLVLQVNWLSSELTNYDFGVPESATTVTRPAYNTGSAISYEAGIGTFIELTEDWRILLSVSAEFLPDGITDSPVVAEDKVIKGFAAITYVF
jgi:outer membrane protein